jgi:hypothetical protein
MVVIIKKKKFYGTPSPQVFLHWEAAPKKNKKEPKNSFQKKVPKKSGLFGSGF